MRPVDDLCSVVAAIACPFVARSIAARGARRRPSQSGAKSYLLQQLGVAHGEAAAQPILVGLVWILVRDISLRQPVAHSGVHIITPREEIVQCFMESYEAVLPQMKRVHLLEFGRVPCQTWNGVSGCVRQRCGRCECSATFSSGMNC